MAFNVDTGTPTQLIGTGGSVATIAGSGNATGTLTIRATNIGGSGSTKSGGTVSGYVTLTSSLPATSPTVQFAWSEDGTEWNNLNPLLVPLAAGTYYYFVTIPFDIPRTAVQIKITVTNGATNSITAIFYGTILTTP